MQLTRFGHACIRLDDGQRRLVIDPGVFSEVGPALDGVDTVLITHEHADHVDHERLRTAAQQNPALRIWAPQPVVTQLGSLAGRATAVGAGESFHAGGFAVHTFGGKHAVIHPSVGTPCDNVGFLLDDSVYHPGDALFVPPATVTALLVPVHAPWSKLAEVIDFLVSVRPRAAFPVHDAMLSDIGRSGVESWLTRFGNEYGTAFRYLATGEQAQL
jgi:L-ascorbate metabolism protein UlaG (beta-lactamase superfamily)